MRRAQHSIWFQDRAHSFLWKHSGNNCVFNAPLFLWVEHDQSVHWSTSNIHKTQSRPALSSFVSINNENKHGVCTLLHVRKDFQRGRKISLQGSSAHWCDKNMLKSRHKQPCFNSSYRISSLLSDDGCFSPFCRNKCTFLLPLSLLDWCWCSYYTITFALLSFPLLKFCAV